MGRTRRAGSGAFCVAALALSIAAVSHAQRAQPGSAPLTEAQTAGVKHLEEVIEVLNTGDHATISAYVEANSVHTIAYTPPDQRRRSRVLGR